MSVAVAEPPAYAQYHDRRSTDTFVIALLNHFIDELSDHPYQVWADEEMMQLVGSIQDMEGSSLAHTKWDCVYHIVWIPKYRKKVLYGECRRGVVALIREFADAHNDILGVTMVSQGCTGIAQALLI
jgi:hypothetical protein